MPGRSDSSPLGGGFMAGRGQRRPSEAASPRVRSQAALGCSAMRRLCPAEIGSLAAEINSVC